MKKLSLFIFFIALFTHWQLNTLHAQQLNEQDWTQFRGPNRNGAIEKVMLSKLTTKAPKLLWKKKIGNGFSEITVDKGNIYTMLSQKIDSITGSEYIVSFNAKTGDEIWSTKVDSIFFEPFGDGPRSTPAIGDKNVYSISSYGKLTANTKENGSILWQIDLVKKFGSKLPRWGFSSSPLIIGDKLIVEVGGSNNRAFVAFNKKNGEIEWENGIGNASYNSPVIGEINGTKSIVFANEDKVYSLNTAGDTLWTFNSPISKPTSMPIIFDNNKIFISAIRSTGFIVIEIINNNASIVNQGSSMKNDYSSSIYYDGYIYGFHISALQCISPKTGEKKWVKRGYGKGSLIRVGDQLLVLSDKGKLIQIKATADAYTEIRNIQAIDGKSWTAPSFSDGKIFLRNLNEMACYELQ